MAHLSSLDRSWQYDSLPFCIVVATTLMPKAVNFSSSSDDHNRCDEGSVVSVLTFSFAVAIGCVSGVPNKLGV